MPWMAIAAGVQAGGSLLSGYLGSKASKKASRAQMEAAAQQRAYLEQAKGKALDYSEPYRKLGAGAVNSLAQLYGLDTFGNRGMSDAFSKESLDAFRRTPGYQFTRDEGLDATINKSSAGGGVQSGRHGEAMARYAAGLADSTFMNSYVNPLTNFTKIGQDSAHHAAGVETGFAGQVSGTYGAEGAARASGYLGSANAWQSAIGGVSNAISGYAGMNAGLGGPSNQSAYRGGYNPRDWMSNDYINQNYGPDGR